MKYLFSFLVLIYSFNLSISQTTVLLSEGGQDCPVVDPTNNSRPHMAGNIAGLEKHLARSIYMQNFHEWKYGTINCTTDFPDACPAEYNELVNMLADLNAGDILHAAGPWGQDYLFSRQDYIQSLEELVDDINNAYDCAGLRRPLIQANIFESVDGGTNRTWPPPLSGANPGAWVEANEIFPEVITAFYDDMTNTERNTYFVNGNQASPRTDLYYSLNNLSSNRTSTDLTPDVTKIEGRMWLYQKATIFIDAGFSAIHMGQSNAWGKVNYNSNGVTQGLGANLQKMTVLIDNIRAYADSRNLINMPTNSNAGIVLTHESGGGDFYRNNDPNQGLIFDENQYPYRGNEIPNPLHPALGQEFLNIPNNPCSEPNQQNTIVELFPDWRTAESFEGWHHPLGPSTNPRGFYSSGTSPFHISLDRGTLGGIVTIGQPSYDSNTNGAWGYCDAQWFKNAIDEDCRVSWLEYQIEHTRELDGPEMKTAFFSAIGAVIGTRNRPDDNNWLMSYDNDRRVFNAIQEAWEVKTPVIDPGTSGGWLFGGPNWNFSIEEDSLDNTSIYSWHITKPNNGGWVPYTYGKDKDVYLEDSGWHTVCLRQDNIGIPTSENLYGVRTVCIDVYNFNFNFRVKTDDPNYLSLKDKKAVSRPATTEEIRAIEMYSQNQQIGDIKKPIIQPIIPIGNTSFSELDMTIAPNPATDNFKIDIDIPESGQLNISLINTLGQKVMNIANETVPTNGKYTYLGNLADLPPGAYLVLLEINNKTKTKKIFKQ